jgi:diguanylate cyclase (GGDEF)-like protein/PAS domain S-box-containing protein
LNNDATRSGIRRSVVRRISGLGIRGRLVLLVLGLGLPFLGYVAYSAAEQVSRERDLAKERNLGYARIVAARLDDYVGDINQLLATLSYVVPTSQEVTAENDALLRHLRPNLPSHVRNVVIWDIAGNNVGALDASLRTHPFNVRDRQYFRAALSGESLAVEAPIVSRSDGELLAIFARPVTRGNTVVGAVAASVALKQLQALLNPEGTLPAGSVITMIDQRGVILARSIDPDRWIGQSVATERGIMTGLAQGEGARESQDSLDGVSRIGGFTTAHAVPWFVYVGIPSEVALAPLRRQLLENLLMGSAALILGFIVAGLIGEGIAQPLRQLADDASILARGELGHRSTVSSGAETGALAGSLNSMAQALHDRALALAHSEQRLRLITDNVPAFISYVDREHRYQFANAAYQDLFGLKPEEMLGKTIQEARGEATYQRVRPRLDEALGGLPVRFEHVYEGPNGPRTYSITYLPDYGDGEVNEVKGVYVMGLDVTGHKELEENLARMAQYDQLTGLPNRYLLHDRLAQACVRSDREGVQLALFYLDLDGFKRINDSHGHSTGDAVLRQFAHRVRGAVRASDTVARLGGDEFVILMEGFFSHQQLEQLARKLVDVIEAPFNVEGRVVDMSTSIGIATFPPSTSWEDLLSNADAAMYEAKAIGRGAFVVAPVKAGQRPRLVWAQPKKPREAS